MLFGISDFICTNAASHKPAESNLRLYISFFRTNQLSFITLTGRRSCTVTQNFSWEICLYSKAQWRPFICSSEAFDYVKLFFLERSIGLLSIAMPNTLIFLDNFNLMMDLSAGMVISYTNHSTTSPKTHPKTLILALKSLMTPVSFPISKSKGSTHKTPRLNPTLRSPPLLSSQLSCSRHTFAYLDNPKCELFTHGFFCVRIGYSNQATPPLPPKAIPPSVFSCVR